MNPRVLEGLGHLLAVLAGVDRPLTVQAHADSLPQDRASVLTADHLSLPAAHLNPDPAGLSLLGRAAVAHAAAHLRHSPTGRSSRGLKPLGLLVHAALEDARAERLLCLRFPGVRAWWQPWLTQATEQDLLAVPGLMAGLARALLDPGYTPANPWVRKARQGFEAVCLQHGLGDPAAFRPLASVLANDLGQMRVRFDARQYQEPVAYRDDNSHLWHHPANADAAEHDRSVSAPPSSSPPAGAAPATDPSDDVPLQVETEVRTLVYPEWDATLGRLRPDWCTVIEHRPKPVVEGAGVAVALPVLRAWRGHRLDRRQRSSLCREGDDFDMDALVRVWVDRVRQPHAEAAVFRPPTYASDAVSLLVLLDLSQSTNDLVLGGASTVLDLEKDGALTLAHTLQTASDRVAIHGFRSDTRHRIDYERLLDFGQALDGRARGQVARAVSHGSTRMGAAIRHATGLLAQEPSTHRAVFVVTDGAPSDVDVFRSGYLIDDAAAAVHEAQAHGVKVCGLVLDPQADAYSHRIFGQRGFQVVEQPKALVRGMQHLLRRLAF